MTGRLVDMSFSLNRKQRITLEVDSDFRSLWDKLNQEPLLDIEIKKHRNKRSHSANAYFHVLVNKIAAETGESDDLVKERLVVAYGTVARDKDGCTVGFKLPVSVDVHDLYKYTRCFDVREEDGKWFNCYLVYKDTSKMDTKEFSHLIDGAIDEVNSPYPIDKKFEAFNFHVINIDGNDFDQIDAAFKEAKTVKGCPTAIIAKTIKGKDVSFMENQAGWHGKAPNDEEYAVAMADLEKVGEALCQM